MKKHLLICLALFSLAPSVYAQEAPPPRKSPRTPVHREVLVVERKPTAPVSRQLQGRPVIIDGERLRMNDIDMRLFGIVPPQLSASYGPQARAALDSLVDDEPATCLIRDRGSDGRFLATCRSANDTDLALELLKRGLAVAARGSLGTTEFAAPYLAAEHAAQNQKIGLWSVTVPDPAKTSAAVPTPVETKKEEKPAEPIKTEKASPTPPEESAIAPVTASDLAAANTDAVPLGEEPGFLMRYQPLITGFIILATALSILVAIGIQKRRDRRAEMQAVAAAFRGELMAARAVCQTRLKSFTKETDEKQIPWPRIRTTLYQAYVGRLGWLGAELARQVASIYGQASDYASYYDDDETRTHTISKRHALQVLVQHIDEVLPRLALIEQTGRSSAFIKVAAAKKPVASRPAPPVQPHVKTETPEQKSSPPMEEIGESPPPLEISSSQTQSQAPSPNQLWAAVRKLARTPWGDKPDRGKDSEDVVGDYTALIEEEMRRFSFTTPEHDSETHAPSASKLHGT